MLEQDFRTLSEAEQNKRLEALSKIFSEAVLNLVPKSSYLLGANLDRVMQLVGKHFSNGILLTVGGVDESIIRTTSNNFKSFNGYRVDRFMSAIITPEKIKQFLLEERAISADSNPDSLNYLFCLGSHEGIMRVARSIFHLKLNNGIFVVSKSYALINNSFLKLKPVPFSVYTVAADNDKGEKILISDLEIAIKKNPSARTLLLELKTIAGSIYTAEEINDIVVLCKRHKIFLIVDATHMHMEFDMQHAFPDVCAIFQQNNFHNFAVVHTCSKSYGLERARVGFMILSQQSSIPNLYTKIEEGCFNVFGSLADISFDVAHELMILPLAVRRRFLEKAREKHRVNMNLMIAYIEGIASPNLDSDLRSEIEKQIPPLYQNGIEGMKIVFKPQGGIQLKVDMSDLQDKYFSNIRMVNSEIFGYALTIVAGVVVLNSSQIFDPNKFRLKLSFSVRKDVHDGMRSIFHFVRSLSKTPAKNPFLRGVNCFEEFMDSSDKVKIAGNIQRSRKQVLSLELFFIYKKNVRQQVPAFIKVSEEVLSGAVHDAATVIQKCWRRRG